MINSRIPKEGSSAPRTHIPGAGLQGCRTPLLRLTARRHVHSTERFTQTSVKKLPNSLELFVWTGNVLFVTEKLSHARCRTDEGVAGREPLTGTARLRGPRDGVGEEGPDPPPEERPPGSARGRRGRHRTSRAPAPRPPRRSRPPTPAAPPQPPRLHDPSPPQLSHSTPSLPPNSKKRAKASP